ncbi:MAG: hypothetical protein R3B47_02275 [Bacteroidia bacterium]
MASAEQIEHNPNVQLAADKAIMREIVHRYATKFLPFFVREPIICQTHPAIPVLPCWMHRREKRSAP